MECLREVAVAETAIVPNHEAPGGTCGKTPVCDISVDSITGARATACRSESRTLDARAEFGGG